MMRVITAPEPLTTDRPSVFLAGGITGCPDWQAEVIERLFDVNGVLLNPRRAAFDVSDPEAGPEQIRWEFEALAQCDIFSMWFCAETIQPICMYELGRHLALRIPSQVVLGVHPDYPRATDVDMQSRLAGHRVSSSNLADHARIIATAVAEKRRLG